MTMQDDHRGDGTQRWVRVTAPDGSTFAEPLLLPVEIGRHPDNDIVLADPCVSGRHCIIERIGPVFVIKDRGSANGTFLNHAQVTEPTRFSEGDRLHVGSYCLQIIGLTPSCSASHFVGLSEAPLVRAVVPELERRRLRDRLQAWSSQWYEAGRPTRLLLRGRPLASARALVEVSRFDEVVRDFVTASIRARRRRRAVATVAVLVGLACLVAVLWPAAPPARESEVREPDAPPSYERPVSQTTAKLVPQPDWYVHEVIPAETLEDIARRYDVPLASVALWNRLNPDDPMLEVGDRIRVRPNRRPLPAQLIEYELEKRYDWKMLSERFAVPVNKLRAYNPDATLEVGSRIAVWLDPEPHPPRSSVLQIPEFDVRPDAISVGRPNDGELIDGILLPKSSLYTRRAPFNMYGSSHTIKALRTALSRFRADTSYDGVIVVADISRRGGGHFPPHASHQAGRDVDIWMPTLRGVHKQSYLGQERKPLPSEVDWHATWGMVRALIETDQVQHIFLEYGLQEKLYHAAILAGADEESLGHAMQWPRGRFASGIVGHSSGHTGHIHVRFKCGPNDLDCHDDIDFEASREASEG